MPSETGNITSDMEQMCSQFAEILTLTGKDQKTRIDCIALERPLEICVQGLDPVITMRTPGHDRELACGMLLSEGLIRERSEIAWLGHAVDNEDRLHLTLQKKPRNEGFQRSSMSTSACGVCGKKKLDLSALKALSPLPLRPVVPPEVLYGLPTTLEQHQTVFNRTGGLHAAALFDSNGRLVAVREDVGRHNAVDKLMGWAVENDALPLHECILLLSGRASFELVQKSLMAGIPIVCSISAPSSYAISLARDFNLTLIGFLRGQNLNIYASSFRCNNDEPPPRAARIFPTIVP